MEISNVGPQISTTKPVTLRDALLALTAINHEVVLLDYGNVVVRRGYSTLTTVRLVSGGVGGTDVSHATFVGRGMLTAAILGEEAAPSSRQILHTIKEANQGENCGVLVIAQANSDLFNFGLAVDRANEDCRMRVKLLPVTDVRSFKSERYSCGFILLTKILGAMAERGALYDEICEFYKSLNNLILTVPLNYVDEEIGLRHRKSIRITTDFDMNVRNIINKKSQFDLSLHPSIPTVALINTSRSLARIEELGFVKQVIEQLRQIGVCMVRMYYGSFLTAAPGSASLTILKVYDMKIIEYLDDPCNASGWRHLTQFLPEITTKNEIPGLLTKRGKVHIGLKGPKLGEAEITILRKAVQFACDALISCERQLNIIDSESSVGNVGTRLKSFAENVNKRIIENTLPLHCPFALLKKLSVIAEMSVGGVMGSIYGLLFDSAANMFGELPEDEVITHLTWAKALTIATEAVKAYVPPKLEKTTMYYAIKSCEVGVNREIERQQHYIQCFGFGVTWAEEGAQRTRLPDSKHPDAGAHAVGIWMRALFEGVKLMGDNASACD